MEELLTTLTPDARGRCDDAMAKRYLRATAENVAKAAQRIEDSVKWRIQVQPESLVCRACARNPGTHYMNVIGYCKLSRPVFYSCMKLSRSKEVEAGKHHLINRFEQAIRMMPEGIEQWVWVSDFFGFSVGDMNPAMAKQFVNLSAVHYPERLGAYVVVDAPYIFEGLWKLVKPWLDPVTVQKIIFVPYDVGKADSKLVETMHQLFPHDLACWLLHEMAENRLKTNYTSKTSFHYKDIYQMACNGQLEYDPSHDLRGSKEILQRYNDNPSLLLPQASATE